MHIIRFSVVISVMMQHAYSYSQTSMYCKLISGSCNLSQLSSFPPFTEDISLEIHERVRRNGAPTNYWWIPGVPSSPSSTNIHRVSCGDPGEPAFGSSLFESVHAGAIVVHSCNPGHRLDGAKLRLCQSNGQWTPQLPRCVCEYFDCNRLPCNSGF